jgi:hypothetical protein
VDCDADWYQSVGTTLGESSEVEDDLTTTFRQMQVDPKGDKHGPANDKDVVVCYLGFNYQICHKDQLSHQGCHRPDMSLHISTLTGT